jgi:arsenite methyltransferase
MKTKGNYGVDSPAIVGTLFVLGLAGSGVGYMVASSWRWAGYAVGGYFLFGAAGMLFYSKVGKLRLRERLLNKISWQGNERVLDVGCGRGLLTVGAASRLSSGKVVGVDVWNRKALSGNQGESVLQNAKIEGVSDRVEIKEGDARELPFPDETFDVVISNFVVHELSNRAEREKMMREMARVLKPGGRVALVDFIFTDECVEDLRKCGVAAERVRDAFLSFWISAILNFGALKTYHVTGMKAQKSQSQSA